MDRRSFDFLGGDVGLNQQLVPDSGIGVHPLAVGDAAAPERFAFKGLMHP